MQQGCVLPNDGSLTPEQRHEVIVRLKAYMAQHNLTNVKVARQLGMAEPTFSPILNESYNKGPLDDYLREINNWMEIDSRRRQTRPTTKYVETGVAKRILGAAQQASSTNTMVLVYGPTGIGKTMCAHQLSETFAAAIYLRISTGNTGYRTLSVMLADRIGLYGKRRKRRDHTGRTFDEQIFDKLRDTGRLLIVDEAHRITSKGLEFIRDVHDECHIPVVLFCTKDLMERMRSDADEDHGQLFSRFLFVDLTQGFDKQPGGKKPKPLFTLTEIKRLFESEKVRLAPEVLQGFHAVANTLGWGSLRRCELLLSFCTRIARAAKGLRRDDPVLIDLASLQEAEASITIDDSLRTQMDMIRRTAIAATA